MSEFKFACPVCGQHITSDSSASGTHLECPTCFQKIVVPQAPSSADSKFILSASQVSKPRPTSVGQASDAEVDARAGKSALIPIVGLVVFIVAAAGAGVFVFRDRIFKPPGAENQEPTDAVAKRTTPAQPKKTYSVPTNLAWTLELTNVSLPEMSAAGSLHAVGFFSEKATLQGGVLTLRQGKGSPPDLALSVHFFAQQGEELSGKMVEIDPERQPPLPKVVLRWKGDDDKAASRTFNGGYALRVEFGEAANARVPGKIYIALPDEAKSFVGGNFVAEIRKPSPPKPKQQKVPKQKTGA
jgi:DNA-directed RNA polymerase subunit RPC12/RpoP